jgi:predicted protein tyrosine phosphatase
MKYFDNIDSFVMVDKAKQTLKTIQHTQSNLLSLHLKDVISEEGYDGLTKHLDKEAHQITESLKQFYKEQGR